MIRPDFHFGLSDDEKTIRETVFVIEQGFKDEFDESEDSSIHLVLYLNEAPIACGRITKIDPDTYQIGRIAVMKAYRGQKVGTYVLKFLENKIKQLGGRKAILHSQYDKADFYKKSGYVISTGEIEEEQGYPHIWMHKNLKPEGQKRRKRVYKF